MPKEVERERKRPAVVHIKDGELRKGAKLIIIIKKRMIKRQILAFLLLEYLLVFLLNRDLGGCQFGITADGQPGYKKDGADTVIPFSSISYIANFKGKYGTNNNAFIAATPEKIQGYELALFGFAHLYVSGAMHVAAISADNDHVQAGSQYGKVVSCAYGGYYIKSGTPYIVKEHTISKVSTVNLHDDVPGYRLIGGVLHFSGYASSQSGGDAIGNLGMDNTSDTMTANITFSYSEVNAKAMLLYLPG